MLTGAIIIAKLEEGFSFGEIAFLYEISETTVRRRANNWPERHLRKDRDEWKALKASPIYNEVMNKPTGFKTLLRC